eukprot:352526-Chlamydomonas_euryale.AAC.8
MKGQSHRNLKQRIGYSRNSAGKVLVKDRVVDKAGTQVSPDWPIVLKAEEERFVCRQQVIHDPGRFLALPRATIAQALTEVFNLYHTAFSTPRALCGTKYLTPSVKRTACVVLPRTVPLGRAGYKLEKALDHFGIDVTQKCALDSGQSTGGFTDCLLQRGASKVFGVDVGYGQVHEKVRRL